MLSDLVIKKLDPMEQKNKTKKTIPSQAPIPAIPPAECKKDEVKQTKPVPHTLRRKIFQEAKGKCSRCGSTHFLEIDHILPRAKGGTNEPRNLRALCRSCNQYEAMRVLGTKIMGRYSQRFGKQESRSSKDPGHK